MKKGKKQITTIGIHSTTALINTQPERIQKILLQQGKQDKAIKNIIILAQKHRIVIQYVTKQQLSKLFPETAHQGVVAYQRLPKTSGSLKEYVESRAKPPFLLVLDGIQDPRNLGACIRTAEAAGIDGVIMTKARSAPLTETAQKAASGAAAIVPIFQVANLHRTLEELKELGVWIYGAVVDTNTSLYETKLTGPIAIIVGNEEKGLRELTRNTCDHLMHIPMPGQTASLNVSVATGICLFEAVRQR